MNVVSPLKVARSSPWNEGSPGGHGRLSLRGNEDGYIGNVVNGSISHRDTLGCLSPAVDSSQPTCNPSQSYVLIFKILPKYRETVYDNRQHTRNFTPEM